MNKDDFIKYVAMNMECDPTEAQVIIEVFAESIYLAISEGYNINIDNFGTFGVRKTNNNSTISKSANANLFTENKKKYYRKYTPYFKPADNLKIACNY